LIRVTTAAESAGADAAAIAAGVPARALMQRAGAAAAGEIARRYPELLAGGVAVHAGPGNNGGDAWVVARCLARAGVRVGVRTWGGEAPATDDARFERECAIAAGVTGAPTGAERLVVDGVLGTGARPPARAYAIDYARHLAPARDRGQTVVALDVPTGLDATTGAEIGTAVRADLTLAFGTLKRGLLVARHLAGAVALLDIGLDAAGEGAPPGSALLADGVGGAFAIPADAHKGDRGKVAVVGGGAGMAGAARLAADAALRSGAGMVRAVVAPESVAAVQGGLPAAMASPWPIDADALRREVLDWADVVLLGPGLGRSAEAGALVDRVLAAWRGPVVLDADALNHFAGQPDALAAAAGGRVALLTPHPLEMARLAGVPLDVVLARRFDLPREFAAAVGATVLLKGVPTVLSDGTSTTVTATGTPALATAGSGDVLGGVAAALLCGCGPAGRPDVAARDSALARAAAAAWAHGRAGELATARRGGVRGTTLDDVLAALQDVWYDPPRRPAYPVLVELPRVVP
jgi:NAD(P)H-hydrate epimerase